MSLLCSDPLFLLSTFFFFFNDTATTEIYTLSLHDALPICLDVLVEPGTRPLLRDPHRVLDRLHRGRTVTDDRGAVNAERSEEHTSELQSLAYLVCRLLLEKKKKNTQSH